MDTGAIKEKIEKGGNGMPGGLVPAEKLDDMPKSQKLLSKLSLRILLVMKRF